MTITSYSRLFTSSLRSFSLKKLISECMLLAEKLQTYMKEMPTMPNPTTTIRFLSPFLGISSFCSIFSTFSGSLFASASFQVLLL